ncbi:MAG: hypothetical protein EXR71_02180 [Myxococcales bacterium]|nr:hypothetical protein [Myxococcales bacterium]
MIVWFVAILLGACSSDGSLKSLTDATPEDAIAPGTLRVDVRPGADELALLPQSFLLKPGTYEDVVVDHELHGTVVVSGTLTAEIMQGFAVASSDQRPLDGLVRASRAGLLQGGAAETDAEGAFSFSLPGSQPYALEIIPNDATTSPLVYVSSQPVDQGLQLAETVIGMGAPVYGRVTDADGNRVPRAALHIRRADVDARSATFTTDEQGWYVARVEPGYSYVIETEGGNGGDALPYPVVAAEFLVEDKQGAAVNLDVGVRSAVTVQGRFTDPEGNDLHSPRVRATSSALATGSLVVEKAGDSDGRVILDLLPGTWTLEVWPVIEEAGLTPWVLRDYAIDAPEDLGRQALAAAVVLSGTIFDANGDALPGATVTATELGAGGYNYSTTSGADGGYELTVPRTALRLQAVPSSSDSGAYAHTAVDLSDAGSDAEADLDLMPGTVLSGVALLDGAPVPFALVDVYDHAQGLLLGTTVTDADGAYKVRVDVRDVETADEGDDGDTGDTAD